GENVWLLLTPTVLIAFLAEQQRHYYAHATRRQRGALWIYLALSIAFLVVVSLGSISDRPISEWGLSAKLLGSSFALMSAAVAAWWTPLGYNLEKYTNRWYEQGRVGLRSGDERYSSMVLKYCNRIIAFVIAAVIVTAVGLSATFAVVDQVVE